jgi:two-component system OmpR family sensor kinase
VSARIESDDAVLEVADRGPGLAPDDAARVFERFYRVDASRSRTRGGSGLGLALVQALVGAHHGSVELETAPGEGATFRVRLPLTPVPAAPPTPKVATTEPPAPAEPATVPAPAIRSSDP